MLKTPFFHLLLFVLLSTGTQNTLAVHYIARIYTVEYKGELLGRYIAYLNCWGRCVALRFYVDPGVDIEQVLSGQQQELPFNLHHCLTEDKSLLLLKQNPYSENKIHLVMLPGSCLKIPEKQTVPGREPFFELGGGLLTVPHENSCALLDAMHFYLSKEKNDISGHHGLIDIIRIPTEVPALSINPPLINGYQILSYLNLSFDDDLYIYRCSGPDGKLVAMEYWYKPDIERVSQIGRTMEILSAAPGSLSVKLIKHFAFGKDYVLIEELAESELRRWGLDLPESEQHNENCFLLKFRAMLQVQAFLDKEGYVHAFREYDWLIFNNGETVKFCGHERTRQKSTATERNQPSSVIKALTGKYVFKDLLDDSRDNFSPKTNRLIQATLQKDNLSAASLLVALMGNPYTGDLTLSQLDQSTLSAYTHNLMSQLAASGLSLQATTGDGACLLHAVLHPLGIAVDTAISELAHHIPDDNTFSYLAQMDLQDLSQSMWGSPSLLPLLSSWLQTSIILLLPNIQTGGVITQVYNPDGQPTDASTLGEALSLADNPVVIVHNGQGHFSATQPITGAPANIYSHPSRPLWENLDDLYSSLFLFLIIATSQAES